jgi:RNA polymerase sigma-70 factor (ECF subfamily)
MLERVRLEVGPESWQAFELTVVEGLSGIEAAGRLGKSAAAVYTAKCRVRKRLMTEAGVEGAG